MAFPYAHGMQQFARTQKAVGSRVESTYCRLLSAYCRLPTGITSARA
jgi:hypothetical protein